MDLWNTLKKTALQWRGLDKYGDVPDRMKWDDGPDGLAFHKIGKMEISSQRKLQQSIKRKEKVEAAFQINEDNAFEKGDFSNGKLGRF